MGRAEIRRFQREADEAASYFKPYLTGESRVKIITHNDADGIAAASILARCLYTYNVPFHVKFTRPLEHSKIAELGKENYDLFVFMDQGTGQLGAIHKFLLEERLDVLILDHHPGEFLEHPNLVCLNPHTCGLNGAKDISAAGIVYSVIERIDRSFTPLIWLVSVGAIGDRQEFFSGFTGVNEVLVKRAIDLGFLGMGEGLKLIGRSLFPIVECLRLSTRPYLPGISDDREACQTLINGLGIPDGGKIGELGQEVEKKLRDELFSKAGPIAINKEFCHTLWGTLYTLPKERLAGTNDAREYVAALEACGKLRKPELGFAMTMGDQTAQAEVLSLLSDYQEQMVKVLGWLAAHLDSFKVTPQMRYVYAGDAVGPTMIGEALSLAIESGLIAADRPVIGIADISADKLKVSARATPGLAMQGVNVGRAITKVSEEVGGEGGGHDVSAAAWVPRGRMSEFITKLDQAFSGAGA